MVRQRHPHRCHHSQPCRSSGRPPSRSRSRWCLWCHHQGSGGGAQVCRTSSASQRRGKALLVSRQHHSPCMMNRVLFTRDAKRYSRGLGSNIPHYMLNCGLWGF